MTQPGPDIALGTASPGTQNAFETRPLAETASPELDSRRAWQLLWSERSFILSATILACVAATIIALLIPKQFDSTTRIIPDTQSGSNLNMLLALAGRTPMGGAAADLLGIKTPGAIYIEFLQSRTVQDHMIDRFDLMKLYRARYRKDARKELAKRTSISEERKTGLITIIVTDNSPARAQQMSKAYVDEVNSVAAHLNMSAAARERQFIEERLKAVKQELDKAEVQLSDFSSKNVTLDVKEQAKSMVTAAATLQGELIAAKSELAGMEQIYSDNNARVRTVRARIAELEKQMRKLGGNASSSSASTLPPGELYPSIRQLPVLGLKYAELYRQAKIDETVYELLTEQCELAKIQEAKELPTVRVLDEADLPERKSFPPRALIVLGTGLLSLIVAGGWVVLCERWATVDSKDPQKALLLEIWSDVRNPFAKRISRGVRSHYIAEPASVRRDGPENG